MKHIKKTLLVAAIALTAAAAAQAKKPTFILPDAGTPGVSTVTWTIVDASKPKKGGDFDDFYEFEVLDTQDITITADFDTGAGKNAVFDAYALYDLANGTPLLVDLIPAGSISSDTLQLDNGVYELELEGEYGKKIGYSGTITGVPVVPEPGTWGLMFAGLAALGAVARRRNKA